MSILDNLPSLPQLTNQKIAETSLILLAEDNEANISTFSSYLTAKGYSMIVAKNNNLDILPLVVNISRPSPAIGWRNRECLSFIDRVQGKIDVVMMLAVVHHLMVTERIPLAQIIELMAEITKQFLIIEFVPADDPMFKRIARGRDGLFHEFNEENFRVACEKHFKILQTENLSDSNRKLYLLTK